jgi:hypothetical protein
MIAEERFEEPMIEQLPADLSAEQLQHHAEQLADYLRTRQRELDHRESQLNAQTAQLESDVRTARIWLGEREADLEDRLQRQVALENEWHERLDRLAAADAALRKKAAAPLDYYAIPEFTQKLRALDEAENQAAAAQAEVRRLREQLIAERNEFREEVRAERQRMAEDERRAIADVQKRRELLEERAEQVEQCRAALAQHRAELQRMHRETLEVRLATEELWAQLSGAAPPAALTRSLGRIRTQLADQYRMANAQLLEQKKELESIRDQLAGQYENLLNQKQEFEHWTYVQREEAERQAARLIARERELEEMETSYAEQSQHWELDRREYEQEIRRLQLQIMPREDVSKVA